MPILFTFAGFFGKAVLRDYSTVSGVPQHVSEWNTHGKHVSDVFRTFSCCFFLDFRGGEGPLLNGADSCSTSVSTNSKDNS